MQQLRQYAETLNAMADSAAVGKIFRIEIRYKIRRSRKPNRVGKIKTLPKMKKHQIIISLLICFGLTFIFSSCKKQCVCYGEGNLRLGISTESISSSQECKKWFETEKDEGIVRCEWETW